jgi:hypothetical protein
MSHIQTCHMLVGHFGVDPDHLGMIEGCDEPEVGASGGHIDVRARLVRLRLERELVTVLLVQRVFAEIVDCFAQSLNGFVRAATSICFNPFTSAPQHKDLRSKFRTQIHCAHGLLHRVGADARVVRRKRAVAEGRIEEEIDRRHRNSNAVFFARSPERMHNLIALGRRSVNGHKVVVV